MSSPKSAEVIEEMQIDDDSSPKQQEEKEEPSVSCSSSVDPRTPIPQNPNQEIQIPQNLDQEILYPQNPVQEITNPQNLDQETANQENPVEEIQNPQNPFEETENPENPVQETENSENPLEETQNPKNPQQEENKWQTVSNEIIKKNLELRKQRQLERDEERYRPRRRRRRPPMQPIPEDSDKFVAMDDYDVDGFSSEDSDTFTETDDDDDNNDEDFGFHRLLYRKQEEMFGDDGGNAKSVEPRIGGMKTADDCILFVVTSSGEEDDDVKTMNYVLSYARLGNRLPQSREEYKVLHGYISGYGECIILEGLENKLNRLKNKFFMLMERIRLYPGGNLTEYDGILYAFGTEVWGSERPLAEEKVIRESMAMFAASKAKEEANQGQKEDCVLFEGSTSEEDDDITTMKYFEAYVRDPITSLEISTSEENLNTLYKFILSQGEDIKLEVLEQKVVKLRKKYSMLRDRISTDPGATYRPYEDEMHRSGKEVWGSRMLEETRSFGIRDQENPTMPTSVDAPFSLTKHCKDDMELEQAKLLSIMRHESSHVRNESEMTQLMQHLQFGGCGGNENTQKRRQREVEEALHQLYGERGDEWVKESKMKVEAFHMDDEKDQGKNEELCKEKSTILFDDDWEVAEDCILFARSKSEEEDDIMMFKCVIAYIHKKNGQVDDNFEVLYGVISSYGVDITSLEVLKKKVAKLLSKYLMLMERIRQNSHMILTDYDNILHRFGTEVWGSTMLEGTSTLLDSKGIGIRYPENATFDEMRASARTRQGRRFRISEDSTIRLAPTSSPSSVNEAFDSRPASNLKRGLVFRIRQDPTTGRSRIVPAPTPTSVDEFFDSRPAINPNRALAIRDAKKPADVKGKGKRQAEIGAPNQRPRKFQRVEELLLLFQGAKTEEEDDLILLRYASAYGRNVTSPTAAGLHQFILANLPTGDGISWFLLKLKLAMLERKYLCILRTVKSTRNMGAYDMRYHRELYRLGRQFWGDEIDDQNPDGNMGTRGASRSASGSASGSGSGGGNEGANAGGSEDTNVSANEGGSVGANVGAHGVGIDDGNEGDNEGGS